MRTLARLLTVIYKYATAFVVVASPLFFIPGTTLKPEATYYLVTILILTIGLVAYVVSSLLTRTWHKVTRFEIISYSLFSVSLLLSAVFARDPKGVLFGNDVNAFSAFSLLSLPAIAYMVRSLPDDFRTKLKKVLMYILGIATFLFIFTYIFSGTIATAFSTVFSGFSSPLSLAIYLGVFVIIAISLMKKMPLHPRYKTVVGVTALVVVALLISLSNGGDIRPNIQSSAAVAKQTLLHQGVFGIGSGDFLRAWQLYRPQAVIDSPYFDVEFIQGSGTIPTLFTTIGIFGAFVFIFFTLGALYFTYRSYRKHGDPTNKHISGLLVVIQAYFFLSAFVIPLSFALMVLWMVLIGFGLAKSELDEHHPSKAMRYIAIPLMVILVVFAVTTWKKTNALLTYEQAQKAIQSGDTVTAEALLTKATSQYPLDLFSRAKLETSIIGARNIINTDHGDQEAAKQSYLAYAAKAVDAGLAAIKTNPSNYQNYVALGRAYELALPFDKEGAYDRAKKSYEEAIKLYPANPYLYVMQARLEAIGGSKEAVRARLTDALKKKQNFADALYLMSQLSASEQNMDEALTYAVEAVRNAPNDPSTLVQAGLLFYGKKDYQNAVVALQKALELDQNNTNIAYFLALSLRDGGRADLAKQIGQELVRRNPGNADLTAFLKSVEPEVTATGTPTTIKAKKGAK